MRFAFFGTPECSTRVLDALEKNGMRPALVVTAPDAPQGRGLAVVPPPVKTWAEARDIDVIQPASLKVALPAELQNTEWDMFIVAAYAKLLPQALLQLPRRECLNVHPSLLPKFRGPSPVVSAILGDERQTGVSIMQMTAAMDAGPVVAQARVEIDEKDWPPPCSELTDLLFAEGGNLLAEVVPLWMNKQLEPVEQDEAHATFTKKVMSRDALLNPLGFGERAPAFADAREQFLKIRAFDRAPRAHFFAEVHGKKVRVIAAEASWQDGQLLMERVIPEGKKPLLYKDFLRSSPRIVDIA